MSMMLRSPVLRQSFRHQRFGEHNGPYVTNVCFETVHVHKHIYSSLSECIHTPLVVRRGVDVVHTDRIGAQFLHESGIEFTLCSINERVVFDQLIGNTCELKVD